MSRFFYSDDELKANKILKMNQDIARNMQNDSSLKSTRESADVAIKSSLNLLNSLGKQRDIQKISYEIENIKEHRKLEHRPELESWDDIVKQANEHEPNTVTLEDIISESKLDEAFKELDDINMSFSQKTSIWNKKDLSFLCIATALQTVKSLLFPYVAAKFDYGNNFDPSERLAHNDKSIESAHRAANDSFRDEHLKNHGKGHWINILYQTVPYDITKGSPDLGINMGGKYHRLYTLGHDPILGWLFGTANILTDCITFNTFQTNRVSRIDPITGGKKMIITPEIVSFPQMFCECYEDIKADYLNLPAALFAQAQHLKSDEYTKLGLPVPFLSTFNENFASKLYIENYDALCFSRDVKIVGASFVISRLIDIIILLTHGLFRNKDEDKDLYEVRTRKILLISNSIASASTIINACILQNPKNLDIGTLLNTIIRLFCDLKFMTKIKEEFVQNQISEKLKNEIKAIDELYNSI